jgi:hypothetical protein
MNAGPLQWIPMHREAVLGSMKAWSVPGRPLNVGPLCIMSDEPLIPTFVPPLITLLVNAERQKGSPLEAGEVAAVRDRGVCMMLPKSEAIRLTQARGYADIDPEQAWDQWQIVRERIPKDATPPQRDWGRFRFVALEASLGNLPSDPKRRHEAFIEIFGRQLFSLRNEVLQNTRAIVKAAQEARDRMGKLNSRQYTAVAGLPEDAQEAALGLSRKAIDSFMQHLLILFTHNGLSTDISLGTDHAIAYEILLKAIRKDNLEAVEEHIVNKDGERVFSEYFGRWLNQHGDA